MAAKSMGRKKKEKSRIGFKWRACIAIMAIAVLLIPGARASAAGVTRIDSSTFRRNYDISTIHIGKDVREITPEAFKGLMNLRSITVSESNPFYASYSNCLYNKDMTELLCFPAALQSAVIPDTAVSIRDNALYGVADALRAQIKDVIGEQAAENLTEWQVPGEHFVHTDSGLKWRRADGQLIEPDTELKKMVASVIDTSTTGDMTQRKQLEKCFNFFVETSSYERSMDVPIGDWTAAYAKDILKDGTGNCYNYASAFAYIAKGLGYDARICTGTVTSSLGGRTPHAWTEVKMGDNWYIFDAEMQDAKKQGYFKQTYESYPAGPLIRQASYTITF